MSNFTMSVVIKTIMRLLLTLAALVVVLCFDVQSSRAYYGNGPWCAVINVGTGSVIWDCQYRSVEECVPNVLAGNRGFCNPSPWYELRAIGTQKPRKRRVR